jgi:release factor glutamine methyltransferase
MTGMSLDRVDATVIISHVLGVNRAWIAANPMRILTESEDAKIDMLAAQRAMGRPVAYLLEKREFYGRDFVVGPEVLIPRPETETLVEAALERIAPCLEPAASRLPPLAPRILDLGTGSGAIALAVKHACPSAEVLATDVDAAALRVAQANAGRLGLEITLRRSAWWSALGGERFDLILSNPPYIAGQDPHLAALRHEPALALTPGGDGLDALRAIVAGAGDHLEAGAWLLLEHGYDQADTVQALLRAQGFSAIETRRDLGGQPRCTGARR